MATLNYIVFPFHIFFTLLSVIGYGLALNKILKIDADIFSLKNLVFIKGLFLIGIILSIINVFFPITNQLTIVVLIIGLLIYFFLSKHFFTLKEIKFIFFVIIFVLFFAIYAGVNDDFDYHLELINNYKSKNLYEIEHSRRISYNSYWLFLNSVFTINYFSSTYFTLGSLLYALSIYDTYKLYSKSIKNRNLYLGISSLFVLIFLLGILNKYKEFGTDVPGFILSIYVLFVILYKSFDVKINYTNDYLLLLLILTCTAFVFKITNTLIFFYLFIILFNIEFKKINLIRLLIPLIIIFVWFFQNINISGCLIWPIEITCFKNNELAINERDIIESFAKGDRITSNTVEGFSWIKIWFDSHFVKLIETYLVFILLLLFPVLFLFIKSKKIYTNFYFIKFISKKYFLFLGIIFICNFIWFFVTPAYRFGLFYNLSLIIFLFLPFWVILFKSFNINIKKYSNYILIIVLLYFITENIRKYNWYNKRYDSWPPIYNGKLIDRKQY